MSDRALFNIASAMWSSAEDEAEALRKALAEVMSQAESDMKTAHEAICKLQDIDPETHDWPDWSPQANSRRWHQAIREKFGIAGEPA